MLLLVNKSVFVRNHFLETYFGELCVYIRQIDRYICTCHADMHLMSLCMHFFLPLLFTKFLASGSKYSVPEIWVTFKLMPLCPCTVSRRLLFGGRFITSVLFGTGIKSIGVKRFVLLQHASSVILHFASFLTQSVSFTHNFLPKKC